MQLAVGKWRVSVVPRVGKGNSFLMAGSSGAAGEDREVTEGMKRDEEAETHPQGCLEGREDQCGSRTESCNRWEEEGILCDLEGRKKQNRGCKEVVGEGPLPKGGTQR